MASEYVSFEKICERPGQYDRKVLKSQAVIKNSPILANPTSVDDQKYIIDLETNSVWKAALSIWRTPPKWVEYQETSSHLWETFNRKENTCLNILFTPGERVFFEGYVIINDDTIWFNIEKILVASPDIDVGAHELVSYFRCERQYHLKYNKNAVNLLFGSTYRSRVGKAAHDRLGSMLSGNSDACKTSMDNYRSGPEMVRKHPTTERIDETSVAVTSQDGGLTFSNLDSTLDSMRDDEEVIRLFQGKFEKEYRLDTKYGFNGSIDYLIDGHPVELKTARQLREDHKYQLQVYLLYSYLEFGVRNGYMLYTEKVSADGRESRLHPVDLTDEQIGKILLDRHHLLLLRRGIGNPSPIGRTSCEYCEFRPGMGGFDRDRYAACPFYCQTERTWKCYQATPSELPKICPLICKCTTRDQYFDVSRVDSFNRFRKAINIERDAIQSMWKLMQQLSHRELELCGQRVDGLELKEIHDNTLILRRDTAVPELDMAPGSYVKIVRSDTFATKRGVLRKVKLSSIEVEIPGQLDKKFLAAGPIYSIVRYIAHDASLRRLLRALDYVERSQFRREVVLRKGAIKSERSLLEYSPNQVVKALKKYEIVCIRLPPQKYPLKAVKEIISTMDHSLRILIVLNDIMDIQNIIHSFKELKVFSLVKIGNATGVPSNPIIQTDDTFQDIAQKFRNAHIVLMDYESLSDLRVLEDFTNASDKKVFDVLVLTRAEKAIGPLFFQMSTLAERMVLIGNDYLLPYRLKSLESRNMGLSTSIVESILNNYSYFNSDQYIVYHSTFDTLQPQVFDALKKLNAPVSTAKTSGQVFFVNTPGLEESPEPILYQKMVCMTPFDGCYEVQLETRGIVEISDIDRAIATLNGKDIRVFEKNMVVIENIEFHVRHKILISHDPTGSGIISNVIIKIRLWPKNLESVTELAYKNEPEALAVVNLASKLAGEKSIVIVTPYIAQASLIKEKLFNSGIDVTVGTPYNFCGRRYDIVILSMVCANPERIVRWPLTDVKQLFTLLTMAEKDLYIIGDEQTLTHNRVIRTIIKDDRTIKLSGDNGA